MEALVAINKVLKQVGLLYKDLYTEIVKMIKENARKVGRSVMLGIIAFAACCVIVCIGAFSMGVHNKYIFSTENWNNYPNDRIKMIDNMESKFDFKNMNKKKVETLLGKPDYMTSKEKCEYIDLAKIDYDTVAQYELNKNSRSIIDIIDKNYVIAYKDEKVVFAEVLIAD